MYYGPLLTAYILNATCMQTQHGLKQAAGSATCAYVLRAVHISRRQCTHMDTTYSDSQLPQPVPIEYSKQILYQLSSAMVKLLRCSCLDSQGL